MGEEVSDYIGRLVPAMQAAYGVAWNIEARGESPKVDDRAWQVELRTNLSHCSNRSNEDR